MNIALYFGAPEVLCYGKVEPTALVSVILTLLCLLAPDGTEVQNDVPHVSMCCDYYWLYN